MRKCIPCTTGLSWQYFTLVPSNALGSSCQAEHKAHMVGHTAFLLFDSSSVITSYFQSKCVDCMALEEQRKLPQTDRKGQHWC